MKQQRLTFSEFIWFCKKWFLLRRLDGFSFLFDNVHENLQLRLLFYFYKTVPINLIKQRFKRRKYFVYSINYTNAGNEMSRKSIPHSEELDLLTMLPT